MAFGGESFRKNKKQESDTLRREKTALHTLQVFPQGDALVNEYAARHEADPHSTDVMREVLYTALDQAIANSALYRSEKSDAQFPYTRLNLKQLAASLYKEHAKKETVSSSGSRARREFITTGIPMDINSGGQFEWIEVALHSILEALPHALKDLEEGRETEDSETYILGYPTNEFGRVSPEFNQTLKSEGLSAFGKLYAEFIEKQTEQLREDSNARVTLTGISLGGSIAAEIGSELIKERVASQVEADERKVPRLRVNLYSPAGVSNLNTSPLRKVQVGAGLLGEAAYNAAFNSGTKTVSGEMPEFLREIRRVLADKMAPQLEPEQKKEKQQALGSMRNLGLAGIPVPSDLKVTEVVGVYDPLIYTPKRLEELKRAEHDHVGSLGQGLLARNTDDERIFGVRMSHQPPYYRESEFNRYDRIVRTLDTIHGTEDTK
jgi:hypothetical protein